MSTNQAGAHPEASAANADHLPGGGTFFFLGFVLGLIGVLFATFVILMAVVDPAFSDNGQSTNEAGGPLPAENHDAETGLAIATSTGCTACHSADGSDSVGPTWLGLYGSGRDFEDGDSAPADDAYLRESIIDPPLRVVVGYPGNLMPTLYGDSLSDQEIDQIVAYIESLAR
jgi:cytochrome c oxidase subunit 2